MRNVARETKFVMVGTLPAAGSVVELKLPVKTTEALVQEVWR